MTALHGTALEAVKITVAAVGFLVFVAVCMALAVGRVAIARWWEERQGRSGGDEQ